MEIIAREGGGYAGVALFKNKDQNLVQGDFNNPNSLFFLLDASGNLEAGFPDELGGTNTIDYLFTIKATRDGGFVMVGSDDNKPLIIKTDSQGQY